MVGMREGVCKQNLLFGMGQTTLKIFQASIYDMQSPCSAHVKTTITVRFVPIISHHLLFLTSGGTSS
jgi:hypothetical protein